MLARPDSQVAADLALARLQKHQLQLLCRPWRGQRGAPESVLELRRRLKHARQDCWRLAHIGRWREDCARANRDRRARGRPLALSGARQRAEDARLIATAREGERD